jgi:hypothetical protein
MQLLLIILLASLAHHTTCLSFDTLDKEERCFTKYINEGSTISVSYQVTGVNEEKELTRVTIIIIISFHSW